MAEFKQKGFLSTFKWRWLFYLFLFGAWTAWLINSWILNEKNKIVFDCISDIEARPVVIVLGAALTNEGELGWFFEERLKVAISLYQAEQVEKILISGQGGRYSYNEIEPAKQYLLQNRVDPRDIFLDYNSKNTFSSIYRAKHLFNIEETLIVSQEFHLPRVLYLSDRLGIEALGCRADDQGLGQTFNSLRREFFARLKAWLDINLNVSLTISEAPIDISKDGRDTWLGN